jgi:very-short-patch-repair endonuclease
MVLASAWGLAAVVLGIVLLLVVLAAAAVLLRAGKAGGRKAPQYPYRGTPLLSAAEMSFYRVLLQCMDGGSVLFAKVGLGDIVEVDGVRDFRARQGFRNRIDRKHVDFLVCRNDTLAPVLAIELDDSSHERDRARARDAEKDRILGAAGVPLWRVAARKSYSTSELTETLARHLGQRSPDVPPAAAPVAPASAVSTPAAGPVSASSPKICPKCGAAMVLRTSKRGPQAGQQFWGCSGYPNCKVIVPASGEGGGASA